MELPTHICPSRQISQLMKNCGISKKGHVKKDCSKRKAWFEKKGKNLRIVCYESNLVEVPSNTWWIDSNATTHMTNTMQGFLTSRKVRQNERYISIGIRFKVKVITIGTYRLLLEMSHQMNFEDTLYLSSISRKLISLSRLNFSGYPILLSCGKLSLMFTSITVGSSTLYDGLCKVSLNYEFTHSPAFTFRWWFKM